MTRPDPPTITVPIKLPGRHIFKYMRGVYTWQKGGTSHISLFYRDRSSIRLEIKLDVIVASLWNDSLSSPFCPSGIHIFSDALSMLIFFCVERGIIHVDTRGIPAALFNSFIMRLFLSFNCESESRGCPFKWVRMATRSSPSVNVTAKIRCYHLLFIF